MLINVTDNPILLQARSLWAHDEEVTMDLMELSQGLQTLMHSSSSGGHKAEIHHSMIRWFRDLSVLPKEELEKPQAYSGSRTTFESVLHRADFPQVIKTARRRWAQALMLSDTLTTDKVRVEAGYIFGAPPIAPPEPILTPDAYHSALFKKLIPVAVAFFNALHPDFQQYHTHDRATLETRTLIDNSRREISGVMLASLFAVMDDLKIPQGLDFVIKAFENNHLNKSVMRAVIPLKLEQIRPLLEAYYLQSVSQRAKSKKDLLKEQSTADNTHPNANAPGPTSKTGKLSL